MRVDAHRNTAVNSSVNYSESNYPVNFVVNNCESVRYVEIGDNAEEPLLAFPISPASL